VAEFCQVPGACSQSCQIPNERPALFLAALNGIVVGVMWCSSFNTAFCSPQRTVTDQLLQPCVSCFHESFGTYHISRRTDPVKIASGHGLTRPLMRANTILGHTQRVLRQLLGHLRPLLSTMHPPSKHRKTNSKPW
jgi:hypothetical protein